VRSERLASVATGGGRVVGDRDGEGDARLGNGQTWRVNYGLAIWTRRRALVSYADADFPFLPDGTEISQARLS
jgi:hypothetical protein